MESAIPLSVTFATLLTHFTEENGATAVRPGSQRRPQYPEDVEDFHSKSEQVVGEAGDVVVFTGALQHCAKPNKSKELRIAVLQQMIPVYVKYVKYLVSDHHV